MAKPSKLAGALARDPKLSRVSPGVYRNAQGGLVNSRGGALPGQRPQQPQRPIQQVPGRYLPGNPSQNRGGQQQPATIPPAPNAGQTNGSDYPREEYRPAVMPRNWFENYMPASPNDVNPYYNPNRQMPPVNDLMYRYPQGQAPDFGAMFRYFEQQRQQPNTVSGILRNGQPAYDTGFGDYLRSRAGMGQQVSPEDAAKMAAPANYGEPVGQMPTNPYMKKQY